MGCPISERTVPISVDPAYCASTGTAPKRTTQERRMKAASGLAAGRLKEKRKNSIPNFFTEAAQINLLLIIQETATGRRGPGGEPRCYDIEQAVGDPAERLSLRQAAPHISQERGVP